MTKKYFPIHTETACRLKWAWSTIFLDSGYTAGCQHGSSLSAVTEENFFNFHNTPEKISGRQSMLQGEWPSPEHDCSSCKSIEDVGGISDRMLQLSIENGYPLELDQDPTLTKVDPVILELFFKNTCNLACVYCGPAWSSRIEFENEKFNGPILPDVRPDYNKNKTSYEKLNPLFWQWLDRSYHKLQRIHIMGGEPLIQDDLYRMLEYIDDHPNAGLELQLITNLMLKQEIMSEFCDKVKHLIAKKKMKRLDILASVDCWGASQEYIRYGFDREIFEENLKHLLNQKFVKISLISTVNSLSINDMPALIEKYVQWNSIKKIDWRIHQVLAIDQHVLSPVFFDSSAFEKSIATIEQLADQHQLPNKDRIFSILNRFKTSQNNLDKLKELLYYLDTLDFRRNLNWRQTFPWLEEHFKQCGIVA